MIAELLQENTLRVDILPQQDIFGPVKIVERPPIGLPPVQFDESEMDKKWGAFGEGFIYQPHIDSEGNLISINILAGTLGLPVGTRDLLPDILTRAQARRVERSRMEPLFGYNGEDTLLHSRETTTKQVADCDVLNIFAELMEEAEVVIKARHPFQQHPSVQAFYEDNRKRREAGTQEKISEQGLNTLRDPDSEMYNAWENDIDGYYLMSWKILPDGRTPGIDPFGNEGVVDASIARPGYGHDRWLGHFAKLNRELIEDIQKRLTDYRLAKKFGLIYPIEEVFGVGIGWHADGTLDVEHCDGVARSCSEFFDIQSGKRIKVLISGIHILSAGFSNQSEKFMAVVDSLGVTYVICSACNNVKESCNCNNSSTQSRQ